MRRRARSSWWWRRLTDADPLICDRNLASHRSPQLLVPELEVVLLGAIGMAVALQLRKSTADARQAERVRQELREREVHLPERYNPDMVSGLPEPARRYFNFAIAPGTRLATVVELTMAGELSLGSPDKPEYRPMRARELLAAPYGFVWELHTGAGVMRISGCDGMVNDRSWTRFWLLRLLPVVRAGGDADHLRSSFGRVVAEAAFWSPAFLLPREGVTWSRIDGDTARVTVTHGALVQSVDIRVDGKGQPRWVSMPRWSNANADHEYRTQAFGGELSDFRVVSGYRVPFRVEGGNFFGSAEYFPFYKAYVKDLRYRSAG
jgi:hypothetical protein